MIKGRNGGGGREEGRLGRQVEPRSCTVRDNCFPQASASKSRSIRAINEDFYV